MNIFDPLQPHRTLSIMPTFQCTAECTHCGTLSSPRNKTHLDTAEIISAIDQAAAAGYQVVVFTGGEPTLAGERLLAGIRHAASCGLTVRMVTNAHWAVTRVAADKRIAAFRDAGLSEINYSTGDQHARFVPLENVVRAIRAAIEVQIPVSVMVETVLERQITKQTLEEREDFHAIRLEFPDTVINIHESPWMPLSGEQTESYRTGLAANRQNVASRKGCDSVLTTTTIQANGQIAACCGLGMRLIPELQTGSLETTTIAEADDRAQDDFLKRWIRVDGPEKILAWAATHDTGIDWENRYAHRCQACLRLYKDQRVRQVIAQHYQEKIVDVVTAEWLLTSAEHDDTTAATS